MQQMWQVRQMISLALLAICTYTDVKENNIYFAPLIITGSGSVVISLVSILNNESTAPSVLMSYIIMPLITGIVLVIISHVCKEHVGTGDALLFATLGLATGISVDAWSFMAGLVAVFIYAMILQLLPKRSKIKSIPLAPFVLTGYVLVLVNEI